MKQKFQFQKSPNCRVENPDRRTKCFGQSKSSTIVILVKSRAAFTLIEVMVVVVLLSLIVIALMAVFNSTQSAFRASVTQTDVLESGRAAMDMITRRFAGDVAVAGHQQRNHLLKNYDGPGR